MAFEQPLEADHVDLNLVSIIARAPVIGSLFVFFGGARPEDNDSEEHILARQHDSNASLESLSAVSNMLSVSTKYPRKSALKKGLPPSLAGSEISDIMIGECSEALEGLQFSDNDNNESSSSLRRSKKHLSWSDYSGQNLVEYMDEESVVVRGPSSATTSMESASNSAYPNAVMTRSLSVRNQLLEDNESRHQREKSYLPKMQGSNHGGIVMPSMHNNHITGPAGGGGGGANSGAESPQWGWYINTTPPTPEMYHSCAFPIKKTRHPGDSSSHTSLTSTSLISSSYSHTAQYIQQPKPNLVFRNLQENKKNRINFPSVPV